MQEEETFRSRWQSDWIRRVWWRELRTRLWDMKGESFYKEGFTFWTLESNNKLAIDICIWLTFPTLTCLLSVFVQNCCFFNNPFFSKWLTYFQIAEEKKKNLGELKDGTFSPILHQSHCHNLMVQPPQYNQNWMNYLTFNHTISMIESNTLTFLSIELAHCVPVPTF